MVSSKIYMEFQRNKRAVHKSRIVQKIYKVPVLSINASINVDKLTYVRIYLQCDVLGTSLPAKIGA